MTRRLELTLRLEALTPLYLGGASQTAELRAPSVKGALRFWYRALYYGGYRTKDEDRTNEERIWGSGGKNARQSAVCVRVSEPTGNKELLVWSKLRAERFNDGVGRNTRNGLKYLGYPFDLKGNEERTAFAPGTQFTIALAWEPNEDVDDEAVIKSAWAWAHFGALGSRSRRGFGALALRDWELSERKDVALKFPLLHRSTGSTHWRETAVQVIGSPLHGGRRTRGAEPRHPHVGPGADLVIQDTSFAKSNWSGALNALGRTLQDFRLRRQPDYDDVKAYVVYDSTRRRDGSPIAKAPERAAFGLPLTFRFGSVPQGRPVTFSPLNAERHGSPLLVRPVLVGEQLHGMFLRLDGDCPGFGDSRIGVRGSGNSLHSSQRDILEAFMEYVKGGGR